MSSAPAPEFLRPSARPRPARWEWLTLGALALLLAAQLLLARWDALAADPRWRPLLERACAALPCRLPAWREPAAIRLLSRDVIALPDRPGVLRVQASVRNDARWAQPWPTLRLALTDADGRVLGARRFAPAEYLGSSRAPGLLAPGQSAELAFDVREPGPGVVGFDFRFE
ncbi:DUF3426 domain-containing protein [Thermomonas flagellata]|uniref:DUF3426 domain-containing protein n=1 Tax=Thermomonas flagellata TaxID=2888524 RepID=UPI001F03FBEC|nr:DUF3426 domain-containing protein [Thermomonas flagellata]